MSQQKQSKPNEKTTGCAVFLILAVVLGIWISSSTDDDKNNAYGNSPELEKNDNPPTDKFQAAIQAHLLVERKLIAPADAVFPVIDTATEVVQYSPLEYIVTSYVDAPNRMGVKIRMSYVCAVEFTANGDSIKGSVISLQEQ